MGLTKQYLRYIPAGKCNAVCSPDCNIAFITLRGSKGRYVAVGAAEDVIVWDLRLSKVVFTIEGDKHNAVKLAVNDKAGQIAVGYSDGSAKTYDIDTLDNIHIFSGHRVSVTAMTYSNEGYYLATGSNDTDVVLWDVVSGLGKRLIGHKGPVTCVQFMSTQNAVVTSSKDTFVKIWDIDTATCFCTIKDSITEVWSVALTPDDKYMITGSSESELKVYEVEGCDYQAQKFDDTLRKVLSAGATFTDVVKCVKMGYMTREGNGRVATVHSNTSRQVFCSSANDRTLELFCFSKESQFNKHETIKVSENENEQVSDEAKLPGFSEEIKPELQTVGSIFPRLQSIRTKHRIKSADLTIDKNKILVVVSSSNNTLQLYSVEKESGESTSVSVVTNPGHMGDSKIVSFSWDNLTIASASPHSIKIWNRDTLCCVRTIEQERCTCLCFVPGDRYVLAGDTEGCVYVIDISTADVIERIEAHLGEVCAICILPDKIGVATGSKDKTVKFWRMMMVQNVISLLHTRTLQLQESVLGMCISPDNKLIAVSLVDMTVKVFFMDTLKFFISLYGHKLPVTCLDISSDSTLIATGSADRNIKIWGLDYGDCHKSIFAHEGTVTSLCFVPKTHYFFSTGKDGRIKQWDADNFERIATIHGHNGDGNCLSISRDGNYVISCGQDKMIRLYKKSEEIIVLEDERETEREMEDSETLATGDDPAFVGRDPNLFSSKKMPTAEKAAELLLECIDVVKKYEQDVKSSETQIPLPLIMQAFNAKTCDEYFLAILKKIKLGELEQVVVLLPFASVLDLLRMLYRLLKTAGSDSELIYSVVRALINAYYNPIISNPASVPVMKRFHTRCMSKLVNLKDMIGTNQSAFMILKKMKEETENVALFREALEKKSRKESRKRKHHTAVKTALMKL